MKRFFCDRCDKQLLPEQLQEELTTDVELVNGVIIHLNVARIYTMKNPEIPAHDAVVCKECVKELVGFMK